jgi:hypothetical protein
MRPWSIPGRTVRSQSTLDLFDATSLLEQSFQLTPLSWTRTDGNTRTEVRVRTTNLGGVKGTGSRIKNDLVREQKRQSRVQFQTWYRTNAGTPDPDPRQSMT